VGLLPLALAGLLVERVILQGELLSVHKIGHAYPGTPEEGNCAYRATVLEFLTVPMRASPNRVRNDDTARHLYGLATKWVEASGNSFQVNQCWVEVEWHAFPERSRPPGLHRHPPSQPMHLEYRAISGGDS